MRFVPTSYIVVDFEWNARKAYDRIAPLGTDLKKEGQRSPFEVRPIGPPFEKNEVPNRFFMLSGHRRWKALTSAYTPEELAKLEVPVIVLEPKTETEARIINLRENTNHRELRKIDLARAFAELSALKMTDEEIAKGVLLQPKFVKRLREIWEKAIPELREFWARDTGLAEPQAFQMAEIVGRLPERQKWYLDRLLSLPKEGGSRRIVPYRRREHTEWKRPTLKDIRLLVRAFGMVKSKRRTPLTTYETAYLDALMWCSGDTGKPYDPWKGQ